MGLYRDENGLVFEVDDAFAMQHGYEPVTPQDEQYQLNVDAMKQRTDRGALGTVNATLTGIASGMTLGGSDYLLGELATPLERQQLQADLENHPYARTGGEIGGQVASMFFGGGSATPTGYLSNIAARETERGLVQGGIKGTAKALGAMGAEGAINNAGAYIGHAAIADTDITAEGMAGALGTGFAFGAVGGGAVLGVSKGTVAARRMFSRFADQGGEKAAESAWSLAAQEALDADTVTLRAAEKRLEDMSVAKNEALKTLQQNDSLVESEKIRAMTAAEPVAPQAERPLDAGIKPVKGGNPLDQTQVRQTPGFDAGDAQAFDNTLPTPDEGPAPLIDAEGIPVLKREGPTSVFEQPFGRQATVKTERPAAVAGEPTDLEAQLAEMKARSDAGENILSKKASKGNDSNQIETMLAEKKAYDNAPRPGAPTDFPPAGKDSGPPTQVLERPSIGEMREAHTAELLGKPLAKEESALSDAVKEYREARTDFEREILQGGGQRSGRTADAGQPWGGGDGPPIPPGEDGVPVIDVWGVDAARAKTANLGKRPSAALVDEAYEKALDQARLATDPVERGHALQMADDLENMLTHLTHEGGVRTAGAADADMQRAIEVLQRYEKASSKLTEAVGDTAHPTSVMKAKALKDAEREADRKFNDRMARATEDAATYGPEYLSSKERIAHARGMRLDAKKALNEAEAGATSAKEEVSAAKKRVADGERAKKGALKSDARAAREAARTAARLEKAQAAGGFLEMLDVPGLPKPSDLPVVGPILGAYLKYKAVKTALGRVGLRIPASADARAAILASKTRDRVARAVDRSLGLAARAKPVVTRALPQLTAVVGRRLFDDGGEHPPAHAGIQEHVAARTRELAAYVTTPGAIEKDVRLALRDVTDPDLIAAAEKQRRTAMEYLLKVAPKAPEAGILQKSKWQPSGAQAMSFARSMEAVDDPAGVMERLATQQQIISLEAAETLRNVYPRMFEMAQQRVLERAGEIRQQVPIQQRMHLSMVFKMPLDASLSPDNLKISQSVFERTPPAQPALPTATPTPAIASDTNLTALYQTTSDRRAMR